MTKLEPRIQIHQTVHGYLRGHELLSTSLELEQSDADRINQLSDLSGLPVESDVPSYLTCYPLPSGAFFAFGRTWLDVDAPRAGCVLTHTLLVPMEAWLAGLPARALVRLLAKPSRSELQARRSPLVASAPWDVEEVAQSRPPGLEDFLSIYFGQGRTPAVWIGSGLVFEDLVASFLDFLWPALRGNVSACTYALQPRGNGVRAFDLLVAPQLALSRFSRIPRENFVGYSKREAPTGQVGSTATVVNFVAGALNYGGKQASGSMAEVFGRLREHLPGDPTALQRLAVLIDLRLKAFETPTAAVAVLDILGALAPSADQAIEEKGASIRFAQERAEATEPWAGIELFAAIAQRCSRPAFRRFRSVRRPLLHSISKITSSDPGIGLSLLTNARARRSDLVAAVARGLMIADTKDLVSLRSFGLELPDRMRALLRVRPSIGSRYLDGVDDNAGAVSLAGEDVHRWLESVAAPTRKAMANALFSNPRVGLSPNLLREILAEAQPGDVATILRTLLDATFVSSWSEVSNLAVRYPAETLKHLLSDGELDPRTSDLVAHSLPLSASSLDVIESLHAASDRSISVKVFVTFIARSGCVEAMHEALTARAAKWIARLLRTVCVNTHECVQTVRVLLSLGNLPTLLDELHVSDEATAPWALLRKEIGSALLGAASLEYATGAASHSARMWLRTPSVAEAVQRVDVRDLLGKMLYHSQGNNRAIVGLWQWLSEIGPLIPDWSERVVSQLVEDLFTGTQNELSIACALAWCDLLDRKRESRRYNRPGPLDVQAMQLCLPCGQRQVSAVVLCAFPSIYAATVAGASRSIFDLFSWNSDWDKAKTLRASLVDAYLQSAWPIGDLMLVAHRTDILKKICSRLYRMGRGDAILAARDDLQGRPDSEGHFVAQLLSTILNVGTSEEWD